MCKLWSEHPLRTQRDATEGAGDINHVRPFTAFIFTCSPKLGEHHSRGATAYALWALAVFLSPRCPSSYMLIAACGCSEESRSKCAFVNMMPVGSWTTIDATGFPRVVHYSHHFPESHPLIFSAD